MDGVYALKGSFGSFDVFKSRLVTLSLHCGLATRVLDKELDMVHVYIGDLDSVRRILNNFRVSLSNLFWTLNHEIQMICSQKWEKSRFFLLFVIIDLNINNL